MMMDCRAHHGVQEVTSESDDNDGRDAGATDYFMVVCKDGAGPFKEISDSYRKWLQS